MKEQHTFTLPCYSLEGVKRNPTLILTLCHVYLHSSDEPNYYYRMKKYPHEFCFDIMMIKYESAKSSEKCNALRCENAIRASSVGIIHKGTEALPLCSLASAFFYYLCARWRKEMRFGEDNPSDWRLRRRKARSNGIDRLGCTITSDKWKFPPRLCRKSDRKSVV